MKYFCPWCVHHFEKNPKISTGLKGKPGSKGRVTSAVLCPKCGEKVKQ